MRQIKIPALLKKEKQILANNFYNISHGLQLGLAVREGGPVPSVPLWREVIPCLSGPVVVAHPLLDVVQFGLQIFAPALLHPVVWRL